MRSMTGYGRRQVSADGREMTLELRTVNHRFLDISFRLPKRCAFLEEVLRHELSERLFRGHADVFLTYVNNREDAREVRADLPLAAQYRSALEQLSAALNCECKADASFYAALPNVLTETEREENQEALIALTKQTVSLALDDIIAMREREGRALAADLTAHLNELERLTLQIAERAPVVPALYRERLTARLREAAVSDVEPQRLAQEVALFADKCAIDEELSRLSSHIAQMRDTIGKDGETGRRLDFLTQELNREVNTIGSKTSDVQITNLVLSAKGEIEKLREQVQNVE